MSDNLIQEMSDNLIQKMSDNLIQKMSDNLIQKMSDNLIQKMSQPHYRAIPKEVEIPHYRAIPKEVEIPKYPLKWVLRPRELNIAWGNDPRKWEMPKDGEEGPAKLWMVSWFEVTGTIKDTNIVKGKSFEISFKVDMKEAFEWTGLPVFMMAKLGKQGKCKWKKIPFRDGQEEAPVINMLIQAEDDNHEHTLYFGLYEIWSAKPKVGMKIHHVEVTSK